MKGSSTNPRGLSVTVLLLIRVLVASSAFVCAAYAAKPPPSSVVRVDGMVVR